MDRARVLLFSLDRDAVDAHAADIAALLTGKGAEYTGPRTPPTVTSTIPLTEIENTPPEEWAADPPDWIAGLNISDAETSRLKAFGQVERTDSFSVFARTFEIQDSTAIRDVAELALPQAVCLQIDVDVVTRPSARDNSPYTYDPGNDHVTDPDY